MKRYAQVALTSFAGWFVFCALNAMLWFNISANPPDDIFRAGLMEPVRQLQELVGGSEED